MAPERFEIPIDLGAAEATLGALLEEMAAAGLEAEAADPERVLAGLLAIADERMAEAIRAISVRRGYDPAVHALVAFGGAGAQHACAVAALLGVSTVLVPPDAPLLSATGLEAARVERFAEDQVLESLEGVDLPSRLTVLSRQAVAAVEAQEPHAGPVTVRRRLARLRLAGQETSLDLEIPRSEGADEARLSGELRTAFAERYQEVYGYRPAARDVELESLRVVASTPGNPWTPPAEATPVQAGTPAGRQRVWVGGWQEVAVYGREDLEPGAFLDGPALVVERHSTTVVHPGWRLSRDGAGTLVLRWRSGS